jgi:DNA adenine methylase
MININLKSYPLAMPGSKRNLINRLGPLMPVPPSGRVIIPFFGTGVDSYYFHRQGYKIIAGDSQKMLVDLHNRILHYYDLANDWVLTKYNRTPAQYLELREEHNLDPKPHTFYLLCRLGFNKLVRHNQSGKFNTPPGEFPANPLPSREKIENHSKFIHDIDYVNCKDFRDTLNQAKPGDLVYLDPPYLGTFDAYTGRKFDHYGLFDILQQLTDRGIMWACSNSINAINKMPKGSIIYEITRREAMSTHSKTAKRTAIEILAVNQL